MTIEDRLRAALTDRAEHIEPSPDGFDRIEEELMSDQPPTADRRKWVIGGLSAAAAVLLIVIGVAVFADDDDDRDVIADSTSTTTTESTTTTTESTTTTEATTTTQPFVSDVDPYEVAFPDPRTSRRFEDPEPAAQAYATEVLGFTDLDMSEFLAGDNRSGEIEISDRPDGPVTVIRLRIMDDETWFVMSSETADITVDEPALRDAISSPFQTSGTALAFEGTVQVRVLAQGDEEPLGEGFVTGSGSPPAGPFEGEISFTAPAEDTPGVVVYLTTSGEDGHVMQATSFPVRLQAG